MNRIYSDFNSRSSGRSSVSDNNKYTLRELYCNIRDAVVSISAQYNINGKIVTKKGNGFFIKNHYIICPYIIVSSCNKILIDVSNVNNAGKSYSYEAILFGIDGIANISLLRIDKESKWNTNNPELHSTHPYLKWGKSRSSSATDTVLIIGNITKNIVSENAVLISNISDNRFIDSNGIICGELLLLSNKSNIGCPVVTTEGKLIGMVIQDNIALSEFFIRKPVKTILSYLISETEKKDFIIKQDSYYKYNKSCLNLYGRLVTQDDYNTDNNNNIVEISNNCKEIVGYRIMKIYEDSPLIDILSVGDIIIKINNYYLGDRKNQISPNLVLWRIKPGESIKITYLKQSESFDKEYITTVITSSYNELYDYPYSNRTVTM